MRTLKVLSLVLALVLCFGLVGTAFADNIDKYADADKVGDVYAEAVNVLVGLGVVDGKSETELGATGTFTREQAAKIITYLKLGKTTADNLPKDTNSFTDVASGRWSAGYIAYCYNQKIVDGVGNGKFNPTGELTGFAWAKMLLGALGYGKNGEYDDPATWRMNVATDALTAGIFTGDLAALANTPIQRQQAMLGAFNAMFAGSTPVTTTSTLYPTKDAAGKYTFHKNFSDAQTALADAVPAGSVTLEPSITVTDTDYTGSLAKDTFGLKKSEATDIFGRPTTAYTDTNGKTVATISADASQTFVGPVTGAQIYKGLGLTGTVTANLYTDGSTTATTPTVSATGGAIVGNGVELSVYYDAQAKTVDMYAVNPYFAEVGKVNAATSSAKENVQLSAATTSPVNGLTYEISGLKVGDPVIVTWSQKDGGKGAIVSLVKAEPITLKPTQFSISVTGQETVTADKVYKYSAQFLQSAAGAKYYDNTFGWNDQNVVLDQGGNIIGFTAGAPTAATPTRYAIFLKSITDTSNWPAPDTNKAQIVNPDGSTEILTGVAISGGPTAGDVVTIATKAGVLTVTKAATPGGSNIPLKKNTVSLGGTNKANDKTVFLLNTDTTGTKPTYVSYTGIGNVIDLTSSGTYAVLNGTTGFAEFVYINAAVEKAPTVTAVTFVYVEKGSKAYSDKDKGDVVVYNAVVDGKVGTLEVAKGVAITTGMYSAFSTTNGLVDGNTVTALSSGVKATGIGKAANGVIEIGGTGNDFVYNDKTAVFTVKASTGAISASSVDKIAADTGATVYYYLSNGIVSTIYIVA